MTRNWAGRTGRPFPTYLLPVSALLVLLSLASVVTTHAMPVEARTTEPWYSYQASVGFNFTGQVEPGKFYDQPVVYPDELMKIPAPVEPPTFRRVLISKFTDAVEVTVPYAYKADRPTSLKATLRIDGVLLLPGIWQKPYPLLAQKEFNVEGVEISGVERFVIPVSQFHADIEKNRLDYDLNAEPFELHITPFFQVEAQGLKEPVVVDETGEFVIAVRSGTVEIDEPKILTQQKNLSETKVVPITVQVLGSSVKVSHIRQISLVMLAVFLVIAAVVVWSRRKPPDNRTFLQKLGPNLILAGGFELPADAAVVDVLSARELVRLQSQAERPVIKVGSTYYLQDGATCYRLSAAESDEAVS